MPRVVLLLIVGLVSPVLAGAQDAGAQGVRFMQEPSWSAVRAKAKAANRHIFMVVYATSCKRCPVMDQKVYTQAKLGDYLNDHFMAVQVQLDTTPHDRAEVKRWYADAQEIRRRYPVMVFPTFLFFSPDGKLVHRAHGLLTADMLLAAAGDALNPAKQYYALLDGYQRGSRDLAVMRYLARTAATLADTATAQRIGNDYFARLGAAEVYAKEHLEFVRSVTYSSADRGFALLYRFGARVDSSLGQPGAAQRRVDWVITQEEIRPGVVAAERGGPRPDWGRIVATITQKYGAEYADRTVLRAKVEWYRSQKDWPNYIENLVPMMEKYVLLGHGTGQAFAWSVNNAAWDAFQYSNDRAVLTKALAWSDRAVKADPSAGLFDTYANLLYKLGRTEEALRWAEAAVKLEPNSQALMAALDKMKKGEPTWPQP